MQPDWEAMYAVGETPWDQGAPAPPLLAWLTAHPGRMTGRVLVPGCGLGHDVRAIAAAEPRASVIGLDLSATAISLARGIPPIRNEVYLESDLFAPSDEMLGCDWVWEHTCFCAIDPERRDDYAEAVWRHLRPGGRFLGIFYLDPYRGDHQPGGGPPHGCTVEELITRFERTGLFRMLDSGPPAVAFPERGGREWLLSMERVG
jgi:SAM-dependent methyltransferase